jgi:hypothetical protein
MATTTINGRAARPTLATQIDRLDTILDGLSENLTEAVADAVKAAVVQAVQTVLTEVLTNPAVLAKLRDALPPAAPPTPKAAVVSGPCLRERMAQVWSWLGAKVRAVVGACQGGLNRLGEGATRQCERVQRFAKATWVRLRVLRHFRGQLLLALAIGVAGGVAVNLAGPWLAAVLGGLGGFVTAVAVQGGVLLLRLATVSIQPRT